MKNSSRSRVVDILVIITLIVIVVGFILPVNSFQSIRAFISGINITSNNYADVVHKLFQAAEEGDYETYISLTTIKFEDFSEAYEVHEGLIDENEAEEMFREKFRTMMLRTRDNIPYRIVDVREYSKDETEALLDGDGLKRPIQGSVKISLEIHGGREFDIYLHKIQGKWYANTTLALILLDVMI